MNRRPLFRLPFVAVGVVLLLGGVGLTIGEAVALTFLHRLLSAREWVGLARQFPDQLTGWWAIAAGAYGLVRVKRYHPLVRRDYAGWLAATPWRPGRPLPLGPPHLVWEDGVFAAVVLYGSPWPAASVVAFAVPYALFAVYVTLGGPDRRWLASTVGLATGGVVLAWPHAWPVSVLAAAAVVACDVGVRRSLAEVPWTRPVATADRAAVAARAASGWALAPVPPPAALAVGDAWAITIVASWCVYGSMWQLAAADPKDADEQLAVVVLGLALAAMLRLGVYTTEYQPPISSWGRVRTGRLLLPGYDRMLIAPLVGAGLALIVPPGLYLVAASCAAGGGRGDGRHGGGPPARRPDAGPLAVDRASPHRAAAAQGAAGGPPGRGVTGRGRRLCWASTARPAASHDPTVEPMRMTTSQRPSDRRVQTVCLLILTLIAVGWALAELQPVLVPFVLALFLSQCLAPLILLLMRQGRLPRWAAVTVAVVLAAAVLTGVGFVVASSVGGVKPQFDTYKIRLDQLYTKAAKSRAGRVVGLQPAGEGGGGATFMSYVIPYVGNGLGQVAGFSSHTATVVLLMAFLLYGRRWDAARDPVLPAEAGPLAAEAAAAANARRGGLIVEIEGRVQQYISVTVLISILTGLLVGTALAVLHVQFAAVFGLLAGVLTFIPNFGGVIATLLPLPVVLLDPKLSIPVMVLAFALPAGVQVVIGSLLQPRMTGQSLDLHPVVILLSLLFFTMIWGVGGAFLAVPLTATFKIVFERIPNTRPLAAALAGNLGPLTDTLDAPTVESVAVVNRTVGTDGGLPTGNGDGHPVAPPIG